MADTARDTHAADMHGFGGPYPSMMIATNHPLIPGYRIERLIGSGGMASVYLAIQESLERPVALKILDDPESFEYQERFLNEGRVIASLNHSNIITVHDIGVADRHLYISMEYVEGGDLRRRIKAGMTPPVAFDIIEKIGGALKLAHDKGVIHRDVKPANILFRLDDTPVLADFGIAKNHQRDSGLTMDGSLVGSPYYLSPEQARAQPIDGRADIYSLGIILFEMLTGVKPYKGESAVDTVFKHLNDPVPTLPEELVRLQYIVDKMLAKDPDERFASMDDVLEAVRQTRTRGFDDIADRMVKGTDTVLLTLTPADKKALRAAADKARSGRRRRVFAAAAGLVVLVAGALLYVERDGADRPSSATANFSVPDGTAAARLGPAEAKNRTTSDATHPASLATDPTFGPSLGPATVAAAPEAAELAPPSATTPPQDEPAPSDAPTATNAPDTHEKSEVAASKATPSAGASKTGDAAEPSTARSPAPGKASRETAGARSRESSSASGRKSTTTASTHKSSSPPRPKPSPVASSRTPATVPSRARTAARTPRKTAPVTFKSSREREVERLLGLARRRIAEGRLSSPARDSALYYRNEALALDPDNAAARKLSVAIADGHMAVAESHLRSGEYFEAKRQIDLGLEVEPGHSRLRALKKNALERSAKGLFDQFKRSLWEVEPDMSVRPRSASER